MQYWLVKQEPGDYSWSDLEKDGRTAWTGVRNFQARINLRAMKKGDLAFFYHSGEEKQVIGVTKVLKEAYPDATATEGDWVAVDIGPVKALKRAVTLADIKARKQLQEMKLVRQSRLSVSPVTSSQFEQILRMGETSL
jgi:predicted RNA-binding protein with PUA-like domain